MDLTPDIKIPLAEFNQYTKRRALAVLNDAGVTSLDAVGAAFWADILFVTGRKRASLNSEQMEALGKASAGLGYVATQYALLSDAGELAQGSAKEPDAVDTSGNSAPAVQQLEAYVQALSVDILVFLEAETAQKLQGFNHSVIGTRDYLKVVVVTDFFASLIADGKQQEKKAQAWQELQAARRQTAMR